MAERTVVTITGSGSPIPSPDRAGPGVLVRHGDVSMQFDAGRSTVMRLTAAGASVRDLSVFFATHHHSDHLMDLADLALTRWVLDRGDALPPLPVVVPDGPCVRFGEQLFDIWEHDIAVRSGHTGRVDAPSIDLRPFPVPEAPSEVWSSGDVRVLAGEVRHEPVHPAVGYRIETPCGVVAVTGDTLVCPEVAALAEGADVLVYEAMRFQPIEDLPSHRRFILDYHADTRLIGRQAAELGVSTLVLTHLIPEPQSDAERNAFERDVRVAGYEGDVIVADDLDEVILEQ